MCGKERTNGRVPVRVGVAAAEGRLRDAQIGFGEGGTMAEREESSNKVNRRKFLKSAATTAGVMFIKPSLVHGTAANSAVRVGLLGCGGRGTEDATNLVDTGGARVVALGDLFRDQLDAAHAHFDKIQQAKGYAAIDASQLFVGPNAYQQIAASKE